MKIKAAAIASALVLTGFIASTVNQGCSDADDTVAAGRLGRKGEACQASADCAPGLACLPSSTGPGGVCVLGAFGVTATAKECVVIECTDPIDCCGPFPSTCPGTRALCLADSGPDSVEACLRYKRDCECKGHSCENNKCIQTCSGDSECAGSGDGRRCIGGKCRDCATDDDCGWPNSARRCVNAKCRPPCQGDGDCPGFERCLNGQCHDGACQSDRECISATRNVEATCTTDGTCIVPCATDLECGNPRDFKFYSCVNARCLYLGCETDKDCRLSLEPALDASASTSPEHVVCRDKQTP